MLSFLHFALVLELVDEVIGLHCTRVFNTVVITLFYIFVLRQFIWCFFPIVLVFELIPQVANFVFDFSVFDFEEAKFINFFQLLQIIFGFGGLSLSNYTFGLMLKEFCPFYLLRNPAFWAFCTFLLAEVTRDEISYVYQNSYIGSPLVIINFSLEHFLQDFSIWLSCFNIVNFVLDVSSLFFNSLNIIKNNTCRSSNPTILSDLSNYSTRYLSLLKG